MAVCVCGQASRPYVVWSLLGQPWLGCLPCHLAHSLLRDNWLRYIVLYCVSLTRALFSVFLYMLKNTWITLRPVILHRLLFIDIVLMAPTYHSINFHWISAILLPLSHLHYTPDSVVSHHSTSIRHLSFSLSRSMANLWNKDDENGDLLQLRQGVHPLKLLILMDFKVK